MRTRLLLATLVLTAAAQSRAQTPLDTRLIHTPLYLREPWAADKLHADTTGHLHGSSPVTSWTLSGVDFDSVELNGQTLRLRGRRVGLVWRKDTAVRVPLKQRSRLTTRDEKIEIEIDNPAGSDPARALDALFTDNLADLVPTMPSEWAPYGREHFLHEPPPPKTPRTDTGLHKVGGSVTAPKVLSAPEPEFSEAARGTRVSGSCLIYLQLTAEGEVTHVRILKPVGMGLDEMAAAAVRQYRMEPAQENGKPVTVEMNVAVNFQIF